jgi:hypothetical protein
LNIELEDVRRITPRGVNCEACVIRAKGVRTTRAGEERRPTAQNHLVALKAPVVPSFAAGEDMVPTKVRRDVEATAGARIPTIEDTRKRERDIELLLENELTELVALTRREHSVDAPRSSHERAGGVQTTTA